MFYGDFLLLKEKQYYDIVYMIREIRYNIYPWLKFEKFAKFVVEINY